MFNYSNRSDFCIGFKLRLTIKRAFLCPYRGLLNDMMIDESFTAESFCLLKRRKIKSNSYCSWRSCRSLKHFYYIKYRLLRGIFVTSILLTILTNFGIPDCVVVCNIKSVICKAGKIKSLPKQWNFVKIVVPDRSSTKNQL